MTHTNIGLATRAVHELIQAGVAEFIICPGARNAPLLAVLTALPSPFHVYTHFEERSAAFFALGRIRQTGRPVAVVTTSGTAAGELLPATMEAHYAGLPLVLVTADRPSRYRNSGAPQTAEQVGIYGVYVELEWDLEGAAGVALLETTPVRINSRPVHLNICFDEPLIDEPITQSVLILTPVPPAASQFSPVRKSDALISSFLQSVHHPLILVGMLTPEEREPVVKALLRLNFPAYLEATSGLRNDPRLAHLKIHLPDRVTERMLKAGYSWDGVIRFGGIPTPRIWRDLDVKYQNLKVLSLSSLPFTGLGRPSDLIVASMDLVCDWIAQSLDRTEGAPQSDSAMLRFLELDRTAAHALTALLASEPRSEQGLIAALSKLIPFGARIYLGNSLPIREWDQAATTEDRQHQIWASRGLNGIDGQVSTFLGYARPLCSNWAILGDLTSLYDLQGPWILSQLRDTRANLVVINNGGGKIFSRMFTQMEFQNSHRIQFESWAKLWNLGYHLWDEIPASLPLLFSLSNSVSAVIEIKPDEEATQRFLQRYNALC